MRGLRFCRLINPRYVCSRSLSACHHRVYNNNTTNNNPAVHPSYRILKKHYFLTPSLHDVRIVETPTFPDSVTEGDIQWVKEVGDTVEEDEVIGEIETDKTTLPVQSPVAGVITELLVNDGDTITKGSQLVKIDVGGGAAAASEPLSTGGGGGDQDAETPTPASSGGDVEGESVTVKVPTFPDSVAEGDVTWLKEVGDSVEADEVIGEIETDKTTLPIQAPVAGVVTELLVPDGSTVTKDMDVVVLSSGGGSAPAAAVSPPPAAPAAPAAKPELSATPPPIPTSPVATAPAPKPPTPAPSSPSVAPGAEKPPGLRAESRVKMSRMRLRIAERLKEAQNTAAMLTTFNEIDMTNIMALRSKFKDDFLKKHNVKLGFMSAFLKASAQGLQEMPEVNAYIDGNEIVYRDYVDISVAVATPKGLVVPVLRNVETLSYAGIELGINELGRKARDGLLAIEDMDGGTFTVSNGGVFGSLYGTPIINLPQSAILGMHAIQDRPVARNGQVVIRPMMYVALTYDHRLIDGREAVTFLRRIKSAVEDPGVLLLDL